MRTLLRVVGSAVGGIATFHFAFWFGGLLLFPRQTFPWLPPSLASVLAITVAWYIWTRTKTPEVGLARSVLLGALLTGAIASCAGFLGPLFLTANPDQRPMLGMFITGPLGFMVGAVGGTVYWGIRRRGSTAAGSAVPSNNRWRGP